MDMHQHENSSCSNVLGRGENKGIISIRTVVLEAAELALTFGLEEWVIRRVYIIYG